MSETTIKIGGDSSGFEKATKEAQTALKDLSKTVEKETSTSKLAFASFIGGIGSQAVSKAFSVAIDGFKSLGQYALSTTQDAMDQEDAVNAMTDALVRTGKYIPSLVEEMDEFAGALERNSKFKGDAILKTNAYIQSLANLDKDGLKRASQATADFAEASKMSYESAGQIMAKVLFGVFMG